MLCDGTVALLDCHLESRILLVLFIFHSVLRIMTVCPWYYTIRNPNCVSTLCSKP